MMTPEHLTEEDWKLLQEIAVGGEAIAQQGPRAGEQIEIVVFGCAYSCCGKGWQRKDGYEQRYHGYVDNLTERTMMLYSQGIGTISYVIALRFDELHELLPANRS